MSEQAYEWDFFLSHAGPDMPTAKDLFNLMKPRAHVFLDADGLDPGDNWDQELAAALDGAQIIVVMISARTDKAYYESEEIATAIQLTRESNGERRVVPLYLNDECKVPFGLRRKHSIYLTKAGTLEAVADSLLVVLEKTRTGEIKLIEKQENALSGLTSNSGKERLEGLRDLTNLYRPIMVALLVMIVITMGLMGFCMLSSSLADDRGLILSVLVSTLALMLASLMLVFVKSLSFARDVAHSVYQR
jgi:hypothetical protein